MKFIRIVFGLDASNSDYSCFYCTCDFKKKLILKIVTRSIEIKMKRINVTAKKRKMKGKAMLC